QVAKGETARVAALREEWTFYRNALHGHHEMEDKGIFPDLRKQSTALAATIDRLTAEHRRIDPLLERGDRAFAALPEAAAAAEVVAELSALLEPHLATEEAEVAPA